MYCGVCQCQPIIPILGKQTQDCHLAKLLGSQGTKGKITLPLPQKKDVYKYCLYKEQIKDSCHFRTTYPELYFQNKQILYSRQLF